MDLLQLTGIVGASVGVGFIAAAQKYAKQIRGLQTASFSTNVESITRMTSAALDTLVEDFKVARADAEAKLFARCATLGMRLVRIDQQTGKHEAVAVPPTSNNQDSK
jgi:hypothetical protein